LGYLVNHKQFFLLIDLGFLTSNVPKDRAVPPHPAHSPVKVEGMSENSETHPHERHAYERPAYERPAYERPAYERPAYERYAYDIHAYKIHAHEIHSCEMHA
jgi:hypothetical protein